MKYSASASGFFDPDLHVEIPGDAVDISTEEHARLLDGQAGGRIITAGPAGVPALADPAPAASAGTVPQTVSRFQARAALLQAGLLIEAEAAVAASDDQIIQLAWAECIEFRRASPTIATLATAIGLTDEDVDQLFITASQISA